MRRRAPLVVAALVSLSLGLSQARGETNPQSSDAPAADPGDADTEAERRRIEQEQVGAVARKGFPDPALANELINATRIEGADPAYQISVLATLSTAIRTRLHTGRREDLPALIDQELGRLQQFHQNTRAKAQQRGAVVPEAALRDALQRGMDAYIRRTAGTPTGAAPVEPSPGTPGPGANPEGPASGGRLSAVEGPTNAPADPLAAGRPGGGSTGDPVAPWMLLDGFTNGEPWVLRSLGREQWRAGDPQGTYNTFTRLMGKGVSDAEVRRFRGLAAHKLGDSERAHADAREALKRDPNDEVARSLLNLTKDQVSTVRLPDVNALGESRGGPDGGGVRPQVASAGMAGLRMPGKAALPKVDSGAILAAVQARSSGNPGQASKHLTEEAQRAWQLGDADAAILLATKALELNNRNPAAYHIRAVAHNRTGNFTMAVQDASASLSMLPPARGVGVLSARAWAFNSMRRHDEALKDSLQARRIKPADGFALINEARALGGLGRRPEMLERLREAAVLEPAKYQPILDDALQLPDDADTELLFTRLPGAAQAPAPSSSSRTLRLILYVLAGGILIAFGLHRLGLAGRAATTARSFLSPTLSPAAEEPAADAAAGSEPAASGFWSRYDEVKELAKGGMGIVYEAVDRGLGRRVAVKKMREELRTDSRERERFLQEARTVAGLRHPNIVQIYQIAEEGLDAYLVFEHVDGETLHDRLKARKRLSLKETVEVLRGVCPAVEHAHAAGLMHRDIKPSNIMVDRAGVVKVMDFGIARQAKDAMTKLSMTNTVCGTPPYMAPEQEQGLVCKESDIFSLGVLAYEMLSGVLPFEGQPAAMLLAKMSGRFEALSERVKGLPAGAEAAVAKALHQDPSKRWRKPSELLAALEAAASAKA